MFLNQYPTLLAVDIQKGFHNSYWGNRNNLSAENAQEELLSVWRKRGWNIFHAQHLSKNIQSPLYPGSLGAEFMDFAKPLPSEQVFQKSVNSAFIGTRLEIALKETHVNELVLMGFPPISGKMSPLNC